MKVSEAIRELENNIDLPFVVSVLEEASKLAIQSLEMQDKLKQWIENYKNLNLKT